MTASQGQPPVTGITATGPDHTATRSVTTGLDHTSTGNASTGSTAAAGGPSSVARRPVPARRGPGARSGVARLGWAAGTAAAAVALFACYLLQSRTVAVGSDGASQALQGWDLLHGNPLLRGWYMTDVSFYTTELPQYGLIELARGLNADVIHVAGAMTYTLLVLAAAFLARGTATGAAGLTRALLAAGIMLAPSLGPGTQTLVLSPDHTGTSVPILLTLLLIDRVLITARSAQRRARWYVPVLVWLALTVTALADAMTIFIAVVPLALVATAHVAAGLAAGPRRERRSRLAARCAEASLAVAALLAVPAELAVAALLRADGGWQVNGLRTALARPAQLPGNARLAGQGVLELFGADVFGAPPGVATVLAAVHLAGLALAIAGVAVAARQAWRPGRLIEQVLLAGIAIDLAAYLVGVQAVNILSTREIAPVLPFAAVLAGRTLGPRLATARRPVAPPATGHNAASASLAAPKAAPEAASSPRSRWLRSALAVLLAGYAAGLGYAAAQPPAGSQYAGLAVWLRAHHLTEGLSAYHQANIITLQSGGAVTLRPVTTAKGGRLAAYTWNASAAWFDPARQSATFLVLAAPGTPGATSAQAGVTVARAVATFGPPAARYRVQDSEVLVWPRGSNLLTRLGAGQSG